MKKLCILFGVLLMLPACGGIDLPDSDGDGIPDLIDPCPNDPDPACVPDGGGNEGAYDCNNPPNLAGKFLGSFDSMGSRVIVVLRDNDESQGVINRMSTISDIAGLQGVKFFAPGSFVATVADIETVTALLADPGVLYVSQERTYTVNPKVQPLDVSTWGLDRIDQRDLPLDKSYTPTGTGTGIHVDIIDTGVGTSIDGVDSNPEFGGRLIAPCHTEHTFRGCADGHGHGTHVAGTVGGQKWGVAKGVFLHSIRVLNENGSGTTSQVIGGINKSAQWARESGQLRIANMSLGGSPDPPLDQAVCDAMADGVVFAIAAGNESNDANTSSPARVLQALTLGASDKKDSVASFSNYGPTVDIFGPGVDVESERPDGGSQTYSGTSMAAPHAAGALALYLAAHPDATVDEVIAGVVAAGTPDKLSGIKGSPNLLLFVE